MRIFLFIFLILLSACVKQKSILICGDHKCINKAEAKQYFEENLTLEIQIISKEKTKNFDLVDLNTKDEKPMIKVLENKNKKVIKKLSKEEIKAKKKELKKKKFSKLNKENLYKQNNKASSPKKMISSKKFIDDSSDICLKLEKCDIDSITEYLVNISNEKDYPNISLKE